MILKAYCPTICKRVQQVSVDHDKCAKTGQAYTDVVCKMCGSIIVTFDGHVRFSARPLSGVGAG